VRLLDFMFFGEYLCREGPAEGQWRAAFYHI